MRIFYRQDPEKGPMKIVKSDDYNYVFHARNGQFMRWGKTYEDDPHWSPFGPEILDIEISTICHGPKGVPCQFCYKSNTGEGTYMSFETFAAIFRKFPPVLTQIAFGIGDITGNPDMWKIFEHCRSHGIIPNVTINGAGLTDDIVQKLVHYCGAVAVSHYDDDLCFDAVDRLTKAGLKQVNIHKLLAAETYESCFALVAAAKADPRLAKLKAIVFLWLKPKGDRNTFHQLADLADYRKLVDYAMAQGVGIGFDSCSAPRFVEAVKDRPDFKNIEPMIEPCESTLFSYYIDVNGCGFPCSFCEDRPEFKGIDLTTVTNFKTEVWNHPETKLFREKILCNVDGNGCRNCWVYKLGFDGNLDTAI